MAAVDFRVLGSVGVRVGDEPQRLRPMESTVLAVLLADHNRPVSVDALVDRVWRGEPPRTAQTALRVHVDRLRAAMRRRDVSRLVSVPGGYRLVVEDDELDALRFDEALRRGRDLAGHDPAGASVLLRQALAEWQGEPFDGIDGIESIDMSRSYLESRRAELLVQLADVELAAGRHGAVVADLRRWCAEFPESEALASSLVLALYRGGDQVAALEECRAFTERFSDEYGLDAGRAFRRLETDLLNQDPRLDAPAPVEVASAPAPIGRAELIEAITRVLAGAHPPALVALAGRPGSGVSTVLAHLAATLPNAQTLGDGAAAVAELAQRLGVEGIGQSAADAAAALAPALSAPGRVLIVDDLESLAPDGLAFLRALVRFGGVGPIITGGHRTGLADHPLLADGRLSPSDSVAFDVPALADAPARAVVAALLSARLPDREALIDRVVASAGGDAFLLTALAREVDATGDWVDAPASLAAFVQRTLAALPPEGAALLALAAVDPVDHVDLPLLAHALELDADRAPRAAEQALAAGILVETEQGLAFRHSGLRRVLAERGSPVEAHQRLVTALAGDARPVPARVAHHVRALDGASRHAAEWTAREASALLAEGTPLAAAERFGLAVELARRAGQPPALWLPWELRQVAALTLGGRIEQAMARADAVADAARRAGEFELFAEAAIATASPWVPLGADARRAQLLIGEALDRTPAGSGALRIRLVEAYLRAGKAGDPTLLARVGRVDPELRAEAEGSDPATALDALRALHALTWTTYESPQRRLEVAQRMMVAATRVQNAEASMDAASLVVTAHIEAADRLGATAAAQLYGQQAEAAGSVLHQWWGALRAEWLATMAGRVVVARRHAERAQALQAGVDPETVGVAMHERMLSDAVRDGRLATLAAALNGLEDDMSGADPMYQLAGAVISAAVGRVVELDYLAHLFGIVRGTFRGAAGAGLVTLALARDPGSGLGQQLEQELMVQSGGWVPIGASAGIGPTDAHLARLFRLRHDDAAASRHATLATSVAHRFAPDWVRFTREEN